MNGLNGSLLLCKDYNQPMVKQEQQPLQLHHLHQHQLQPGAPAAGSQQIYQKRHRTTFNQYQLTILDEAFKQNNYPSPTLREALAKKTNLDVSRVQVWFQNRRAKFKKQTNQTIRCQLYSANNANNHHLHHHHHHHSHVNLKQQPQQQQQHHHYPSLLGALPLPPISAVMEQQHDGRCQLAPSPSSSMARSQRMKQEQHIALDLHLNSSSNTNNNGEDSTNNNGPQQQQQQQQKQLHEQQNTSVQVLNPQSQQHVEQQQLQYYEYYKQHIGSLARSTVEYLI